MSKPIDTTQNNHQRQLADHLEAMHADINKICMEEWATLAKEEFDPKKVEKIKAAMKSISKRAHYAQNCAWWIEQEGQAEIKPATDQWEGLPVYNEPTDNAIN